MIAFRCSSEAERRGDTMAGTAPPQERILLVHQPGPWGPRGLVESRCDPEVARRIDAAGAKAGMRLQAIRRHGKHETGPPVDGYLTGIATVGGAPPSITWWRTNELAEIATELERGWPRLAPVSIDTAPLYLVCAHGRHDACCALRGRPVARALEAVRPGRVWETTHLGGDRFAANVLVLPTGDLYGRLPAEIASAFADRIDAGEVVPAFMRGRIGRSAIEQTALVYAHERLGIAARAALNVVATERIDADRAQVRLTTPTGTAIVTVVAETRPPAQLTCRGTSGVPSRQYRGIAIEPA